MNSELKESLLVKQSQNEQPTSQTVETFAKSHYMWFSIAAAFVSGIQNYLYSQLIMNYDSSSTFSSVYLTFPRCFAMLSISICYHIYQAIQQKKSKGFYWNKSTSAYFIKHDRQEEQYKLNKVLILIVILRSFIAFAYQTLTYYLIVLCMLCQVNYSIMTNLFLLDPFVVAFTFYCLFNEKLTRNHCIGFIIILTSVILLSFSDSSSSSDSSNEQSYTILAPIGLTLMIVILKLLIKLLTRFSVIKSTITSNQFTIDVATFTGTGYFILFWSFDRPYSFDIFFQLFYQGFLVILALALFNTAVAYGKAAIAVAIYYLNILVLLLLEVVFAKEIPTNLQIVAFFIGIFGGLFLVCRSEQN